MGPSLILMDPAYAVERMASSRRGLEAYIKKKSLEPLETYVPVVLAARCVDKPRLTVGVKIILVHHSPLHVGLAQGTVDPGRGNHGS